MPIRKYVEDSTRPKPAPVEFAGQWVAWDHDRTEVLAHGKTLKEASRAAAAIGYPDPLLERVRRPDERIIG